MPWFEDLQLEGRGSFRGNEFFVDNVNSGISRRTVVHEFPGKDKPFVEDLGRGARRFTINAYVLGPEYMVARDNLRIAIEDNPGPGELIHPYWGTMQVTVVGEVRIRETPREGGLARITFQVVEAGDELAFALPDLTAIVEAAAEVAIEAEIDDFVTFWEVVGFIAAIAQAAIDAVNAVTSAINQIKGYVNAVMAVVDAIGEAIESVANAIADLILLPGQLADQLNNIINELISAIESIGDAWNSYFDDDEEPGAIAGDPATAPTGATPSTGDKRADILMKTWREVVAIPDTFAEVPTGTPSRDQQAQNQAALLTLVKALVTVNSCRAITQIPFSSLTKAEEVRDELLTVLDELIENATEATYGPYVDLRVAVVEYLQSATADLPRVIPYVPATTLPSLVIAHQLYGDSRRERDVLDRNKIRNPLEVPGGQELEVLSDG